MLFEIREIDVTDFEYDNALESLVIENLPKHLLRKFKKLKCNACSSSMQVGLINLRRDVAGNNAEVGLLKTTTLDGRGYARATRKKAKTSWQRVMMQVRACQTCRKFAWTGDIHEIDCEQEIQELLARIHDKVVPDDGDDKSSKLPAEADSLDVEAFVENFGHLKEIDLSNL